MSQTAISISDPMVSAPPLSKTKSFVQHATLIGRDFRPDRVLTLKLAAIMLPYVLLICGGAFLSGILQVHKRFGPPAAAPIILNACHILVLLIGAKLVGLGKNTPLELVVAKQ